jgi:predicted amidohydrolase
LSKLAQQLRVTIIAGGFPELSPDARRPYNTCAVFSENGELCASYRKVHLFDVDLADGTRLRESEATLPGSTATVVNIAGFEVGLSICYDLRFPELYRLLLDRGARVLVVPAAFTLHTGKDHWHVLLRARAIEAQCWVLAAAQWGQHPNRRSSYGHSLIVDPWGKVLADGGEGPGYILADIDSQAVVRARQRIPALEHDRMISLNGGLEGLKHDWDAG